MIVRAGHLKCLLSVCSHLKKKPNRIIIVDTSSPNFINCEERFKISHSEELSAMFPNARKEID